MTDNNDSARPNWETLKANWPNSAHSRFVQAASMTWHVQEMGDAAKPKMLLLHGTGASTHSFGDLMPLLAQHYHCIALDLPGHGFTGKASSEGLSLPGMARSIAMLLKELNFAPDYCAGHSAGA
ncbi:MAG: alpha/beta fold hydrolase, partial [Ahrensia sp.]|nr:alpha/beta fold hydrolase [Ahrensia sp.]